jgi:hypothetical protein
MELFLWSVGALILGYFMMCMRAFKAQKRLQICIDNGKVLFDGVHIELAENLTEVELKKLEFERDYYLKVRRLTKTLPDRLHLRNSAY